MKQKSQQAIKLIIKLLVAFGLMYWLVQKGVLKVEDLKDLFKGPTLIIGVIILGCTLFIANMRWLYLMRARGIKISYFESLKLSLIGIFFNYALPGGVGGDLVKGYYVVQDQPTKKLDSAVSVLMDRIMGLYSMIFMSLLALVSNYTLVQESVALKSLGGMVLLVFCLATAGLGFGISRRVRNHKFMEWILTKAPGGKIISKLYDGFQAYRSHLGTLVLSIVLSLLAQSGSVFFFYTIGSALNFDLQLSIYFFAVPLGMIVSALPLAPAGIGVGQVAMAGFLGLFTSEAESLGAVSMTAFQVSFFFWGLIGMLFYLNRGKLKIEENAEDSI